MAISRPQGRFSIPVEIWRAPGVKTVKTVVYSFNMGDVEDPYLYAAQPIHEWQQTEMGQWCMKHLVNEGTFVCEPDPLMWGYRVAIIGELAEKDHTYFRLKYSENKGI